MPEIPCISEAAANSELGNPARNLRDSIHQTIQGIEALADILALLEKFNEEDKLRINERFPYRKKAGWLAKLTCI